MSYWFLPYTKIDNLLNKLKAQGYDCLAPIVQDHAVVYNKIEESSQLPWGYIDTQRPGKYEVKKTSATQSFGFTLPAQSIKPVLFKTKETVWKVKRNTEGKLFFDAVVDAKSTAIFGVRPCDLRAIGIQDRIFIGDKYQDERYVKRRNKLFIIVVNCAKSHDNCFCISMGDEPRASSGFDIAMNEVNAGFVLEVATDKAKQIISDLDLPLASDDQVSHIAQQLAHASQGQKSIKNIDQVRTKLIHNYEHKQWDDVANRCLSCGNCTNSCPTCFCHTQSDEPTMNGEETAHVRHWDSCFSLGHSYTHGEIYRQEPKHRYRQWLTHKFATWYDQFDTPGCVGCGRCITWCPVKIDVVDEVNTICKD